MKNKEGNWKSLAKSIREVANEWIELLDKKHFVSALKICWIGSGLIIPIFTILSLSPFLIPIGVLFGWGWGFFWIDVFEKMKADS